MTTEQATTFNRIEEALIQRFHENGRSAAAELRRWLTGEVPLATPHVIARLLRQDLLDLLFDSFWRRLPFGTGGRRGTVGYGPNRINATIVAMTVQGHCDYLRERAGGSASVVVANDVRVFQDLQGTYTPVLGNDHPLFGASSRTFARLASEIYAGNGIRVYFAEPDADMALLTTPMLSFAIRRLGASGGVNLSASHNPPDDNGVKVYDENGAQPVPPYDQALADIMEASIDVKRLSFDEARRRRLIEALPDEIVKDYVQTYSTLFAGGTAAKEHVITYTPLCGAGLTTAGMMLSKLGFAIETPSDQGPDGLFSSIPFRIPNPEVSEATYPAEAFADAHNSSIVISTDPDADRIGLDVRTDGTWLHFDGNQIAAVLTYFLTLDPQGPRRNGLIVTTLVTTRLLTAIAKKSGCAIVDDLLVGFKYIADVLKSLETSGSFNHIRSRPHDLVIAAEESHGVLLTSDLRDKDATGGAIFLAALHQRLRADGRTLFDYYLQVLEEAGAYENYNRSIMLRGADGITKRDAIMASLRREPPKALASAPVQAMRDRWDIQQFGSFLSPTDEASRNLVELECEGFRVIVRPSGTEPKIKLYCEVSPRPTRNCAAA